MTTCILLAAACLLPALIVSTGRCYREEDLLTSAMVFLCAILIATFVSASFHTDYIMSFFDTYGMSFHSNQPSICVAILSGSIFFGLLLLITVRTSGTQLTPTLDDASAICCAEFLLQAASTMSAAAAKILFAFMVKKLFCRRGFLLDGSGGELGLSCSLVVLKLFGDVDSGAVVAGGEGSDDGNHEDEYYQTPGDFLEDIGGLTHTECLVACHEIAGQALAFTVLEKNCTDKQEARQNDEHCKDCKYCVHILIL